MPSKPAPTSTPPSTPASRLQATAVLCAITMLAMAVVDGVAGGRLPVVEWWMDSTPLQLLTVGVCWLLAPALQRRLSPRR